MFQVVVFCLVSSMAAWPDNRPWPWDASPCNCDGISFLSKADGENPCGCNFIVKTPRRELTAMTNGQLESMASELQEEVDKLQTTLDDYQKGNSKKLEDLKTNFAKIREQKKKQASTSKSAWVDRSQEMKELKKQSEDDQAQIKDINDDLDKYQLVLKDTRINIALRMQDVEACGCDKNKTALVFKHARPFRKSDVDYDLVYKIEKLERSKAKLSKQITKEQTTFGWKSRYLMKTIDEQKIDINVEGNENIKYTELDNARLKSIVAQQDNIKRVLERKTAQLQQVEKDADEAEKRYDSLEEEMKQCGCKKPSDTVLDMRKLTLGFGP